MNPVYKEREDFMMMFALRQGVEKFSVDVIFFSVCVCVCASLNARLSAAHFPLKGA